MQDRTNERVYTSYFPHLYYSDSINIRSTSQGAGNLSPSNNYLGSSTYHQWSINWPYSSGSNVHDKIAVKMSGGITCCRAYSSLASLSDNYITYTALWVNTKANTSVYQMPSRSSGSSTNFRINNVINPNAVNFADY